MKKSKVFTRINDYDCKLIHDAIVTYRSIIKTMQNGFTLGEFAKAAKKKYKLNDEVGKELYAALKRNEKEVVAL